MRFFVVGRRVAPSIKIVAALAILFVLTTILFLSVQAATVYIIDNDANLSSNFALTVIDGKPVVAYYDGVTTAIKLAACANAACETGTTTVNTVVTINHAVTVTMTSIGGNPFIVYSDATAKQLKTIACSDLTCSAPAINPVTDLLSPYSKVKDVIDVNGKPLIVYLDVTDTGTVYRTASLKTAACADAQCSLPATFSTLHADTDSDWGEDFHAAYSGGYPIISFIHENQLKLGVCPNLICDGYANWRILDSEQSVLSVYDSFHGLTFVNGNPLIVYQTNDTAASPQVRTAACSDPTCLAAPTINKHIIPLIGRLAAVSVNNRAVMVQTAYNGLVVSTCTDEICSSFTSRTLSISDFGKRDPKIVNVGGYPGIAYLHQRNAYWSLSYYYDGDYTPVQPPTPSLVPTATFTPLPTYPPTLRPTARPAATVTPLPPAPTLSAPSFTTMIDIGNDLPFVMMKLDHQELPVIAYRKNNEIWLARCTDASVCNPQFFPITTSYYASNLRLAVNRSGIAFVSYYVAYNQLNLAACDSATTCDTTNRRWTFDNTAPNSVHAMILDQNDAPVLAYPAANRTLKIIRCESAVSCNAPAQITMFDPTMTTLNGLALAMDANNVPVLAYSDSIYKTLKLARCESATSCDAPTIKIIGVGNSSVDLQWVAGVPVIGYIMNDYAYHGTMMVLTRCESATTCDTPTQTLVDAVPYSSYTNRSFLAFDTSERPVLTYIEGGDYNVRLAYCDSLLCAWPDRLQVVNGGNGTICRNPTVAIDTHGRLFMSYNKNFNDGNGERLMLYMGRPADLPPVPAYSVAPYRNFFTMHTLTLTWGIVSWAAGYEIQIDDSRSFSSPVYSDNTLSAPEYRAWFNNGTYYWRVRAKDAHDKWGGWSAIETFVVAAP